MLVCPEEFDAAICVTFELETLQQRILKMKTVKLKTSDPTTCLMDDETYIRPTAF